MISFYEDDHCTIYHGDCLELIGDLVFDVVVTDPPYGIGWTRGVHAAKGSRAHAGIANDGDTSVRDAALMACVDRPAAVFGSFAAPPPEGVRQTLVWQKPPDAGLVGSTTCFRRDAEPIYMVGSWSVEKHDKRSSVLRSSVRGQGALSASTGHPHTKPVDLIVGEAARAGGPRPHLNN